MIISFYAMLGCSSPVSSRSVLRPQPGLCRMHAGVNTCVRLDNFAGFDDLLEAPEILVELLAGLFAEQLGNERADFTARRRVAQFHPDDGAAPPGGGFKADGA